jgi:hypothetical protein
MSCEKSFAQRVDAWRITDISVALEQTKNAAKDQKKDHSWVPSSLPLKSLNELEEKFCSELDHAWRITYRCYS